MPITFVNDAFDYNPKPKKHNDQPKVKKQPGDLWKKFPTISLNPQMPVIGHKRRKGRG